VVIFGPVVGGPTCTCRSPVKMNVRVSEYCVAGDSPLMVAFISPSAVNLPPSMSTDALKYEVISSTCACGGGGGYWKVLPNSELLKSPDCT
jgi:hypothetical protein